MMNCSIEYSTSYEDISQIHDALYEYNLSKTGSPRVEAVAKRCGNAGALVVRGEDGNIYGGVVWHVEKDNAGEIFVDYMFLSESLRGQGKGRELFEMLEKRMKSEGFKAIKVTTNSFQAPDFYLSLGYKETGSKHSPVPAMPENIHFSYRKDL